MRVRGKIPAPPQATIPPDLQREMLKAAEAVRRGGLVVFPTDTVYGLGCNPFNQQAVRKLIKLKGRERKPLPILVSNLAKARRLAYFSPPALDLAGKYWPGPLTMVLPSRKLVPRVLRAGSDTVGLRMPNSPVALRLIEICGGYLIGTSANKAGGRPARSASQAVKALGADVDYVIDGGRAPIGVSSTVVEVSRRRMRILREGPVKALGPQNLQRRC